MTDWSTTFPRFRVEHKRGVDYYSPEVAMSFDGGSLVLFKDQQRTQLLHAYGPSMDWDCGAEVSNAEDQVCA